MRINWSGPLTGGPTAARLKIYLAGPMTGHALWNFPAFDSAASQLRASGHEVVSPAELDRAIGFDERCTVLPKDFMQGAMRRDIAALLTVDAIALMAGWRDSSGSRFELEVARRIGLDAFEVIDGGLRPLVEETVLQEAQRIVHGDRHEAYGHPADDFTRTGRMWGAVLGIDDIAPELVGLCMVMLKASREVNKPGRDNRVDMAGYAETIDLVHSS